VADWMHKAIGGIRPLEPGYARVLIAPQPGEGIGWAKTSLKTAHGEVRVEWTLDGGAFRLEATVPAGVAADVVLPDGARHAIEGGTASFSATHVFPSRAPSR